MNFLSKLAMQDTTVIKFVHPTMGVIYDSEDEKKRKPFSFTVFGAHTPEYKKAQRTIAARNVVNKRLLKKGNEDKDQTEDEIIESLDLNDEQTARLLSKIVNDCYIIKDDGKQMACNEKNMFEIFSDHKFEYLIKHIDKELAKDANFTQS